MATRKYPFPLPITISSFKANFVPGILKEDGVWDSCPDNLQNLFLNHGWDDVVITQEDLDELDNNTWQKIKVRFQSMS